MNRIPQVDLQRRPLNKMNADKSAKPALKPQPEKKLHTRRKHRATTPSKHSAGEPFTGHTERLNLYIKRAFELKTLDWSHRRIAEHMAEEFGMKHPPSIVTVSTWLDKANFAYTLDISKLASQMLIEQFNILEEIIAKWMPIAVADSLTVTRWSRINERYEPDEDAIAEQAEATKIVLKTMERQAKLLGLDLEKKPEGNKDEMDLNTLHLWIIGKVNENLPVSDPARGSANNAVIPTGTPPRQILELRSGRPEIDELDKID